MIERTQAAFAGSQPLTVLGAALEPGDTAPPFELLHLGPNDTAPHPVRLADTAGMVRLLNVVNSVDTRVCDTTTRRLEALRPDLPPGAVVYTVSMDLPHGQARWCTSAGIMHELLSAHRDEHFGRDYGVLIKEWRVLQRAVFVIDRVDRIAHAEYVANQDDAPDYERALDVLRRAAS